MPKTATAVEAKETLEKTVKEIDIEQLVRVRLPRLEVEGTGEVDQTVTVFRNGKNYQILRGESVEVPKWVFIQLAQSGQFSDL